MKKIYLIVLVLTLSYSCAVQKKDDISYKIEQSAIVLNNETVFVNELRFYKIQSAMDGMKLMYENYGKWDVKKPGRYHERINQIIWKNVKLLPNESSFQVIADGIETKQQYFASLIVLDEKNKDCFREKHPLREQLITLFTDKMSEISDDSELYRLFK